MITQSNINNTQETFSLDTFKKVFTPDHVGTFRLPRLNKAARVNHLLVKQPNEGFKYPSGFDSRLEDFVKHCYRVSLCNIPDTHERYVYVTFDNAKVISNDTQRNSGYHIDGLQGDEVENKVNNCYQFICSNTLPTIFAKQPFDTSNISLSRDNVFKALGSQVDPTKTFKLKANEVYFMNPYMVHKGQVATRNQQRSFIRVYFSHLPITSVKATLNNNMKYKFKTHTTSGCIPDYIK